jgi:hypothetical protein
MLQDRLADDLKQTMKSHDKVRLSVIRQLRADVKNAEIAKQKVLDDSDVLGVISKAAKQRRESIEEFKKGGRQDLVEAEQAELAIIEEYLPQQMTRDEVMAAARKVIEEMGASCPGDKGKVMPRLVSELKGKAEGREINEVVTELLSS